MTASWRTAGSAVKAWGTPNASAIVIAASAVPARQAEHQGAAGGQSGGLLVAGAERGADVDLGGDGERVEGEREQVPDPVGDLLARQRYRPEPGGDGGDGERHDPERDRPDRQPVAVAEQRADVRAGRALRWQG